MPQLPNRTAMSARRYRYSVLAVAAVLVCTFAGAARPAQAQWTTFDIPQMLGNVWDKLKDAATWAYERGAAIAFRNAAKTFTQQIAYNAAVQLTSGGEGQLPLFEIRNFGQVVSDAADSAAGSYIETLSKGFTGFNVCDPGGLNAPQVKLIIGTALFQEVKPSMGLAGGCKLSTLKDNWERTLNDPRQRGKLLDNFGVFLQPHQNDLGVALKLQQNLIKEQQTAKERAAAENTKNQGYLPITETITNYIKTPAPELKANRDFTTQQIFNEPLVFTGDIIADALGVFTNTFAARFMKRLQEGVVRQPSKLASGRFGGSFGAPAGGVEYAIEINSSLSTPELKQESVDVVSEFSNCPSNPALAPPNACTIDTRFTQVLRLAQSGTPLTVQEAVDRGLIAGNWVMKRERPRSERVPTAWYISDLKKLRRARIIPVGWELAAELVVGSDKTLQQIMGTKGLNYSDGFNGTGDDGVCGTSDDTARLNPQDASSPSLCGLIDPAWVLKAPPAQCRILAYGQQLEFEGGQRQQSCVDLQHCVAENDDGSCQAWGYCTQEKNIWRFSGQSCEFPEGSGYSPYATCTTFSNRQGQQVSYLKNSLVNYDDGVCAGAAGCRWYSSAFTNTATCQGGTNAGAACTPTNAATVCTGGGTCQVPVAGRYSDADASRLYLKEFERYACEANAEGCHQFLRLSQLNISALPAGTPGANPVEQVVNHVVATPTAAYQNFSRVATVTLREAPANLRCYDADATNDDPQCKSYLALCQASEVGCELYTPRDGSPGVPAVASVGDTCPTECAGFNTYEQLPAYFDPSPDYDPVAAGAQPDANFIPTTALKCSASEVGCEEFTNVQAGETREYYSELRQCVQPEEALDHTYYTWVGSDLTGYQLRSWQLKAENVGSPSSAPAVTSTANTFNNSGDCRPDGTTFPTGDPDCKQFYDPTGSIHYRFASKTITASATCNRYRATNVNEQTACEGTGGVWEQPGGAGEFFCFYRAIPQEGKRCSAQANGCREFRGPTSDNVKFVFPVSTFGDREPGVNADATPLSGWGIASLPWTQGTSSTESTSAFGHSLDSGADGDAGKDVSGLVVPGRQYVLTFWAKQRTGAASVFARFFNPGANDTLDFGPVQPITQEWQVFTFGPVEVPTSATTFDTTGTVVLYVASTGDNLYLDNVSLREVQDTFFVRKNTWNTPISCQAPDHLRCTAYTDRARNNYTLTGFSQLCRAEAVGCEALVDTRNSDSPRSTTFSADNQAALASLDLDKADQVAYRVYDTKKSCPATAQACYRVGEPRLAATGEVTDWSDKFVKLDPDSFTRSDGTTNPLSPLCGKAQDRCSEFKDASNGSHFFRDPGTQVCEYKLVDNLRGYDWYKKGTAELCNLVPNGGFEQFTGTIDDTQQDVFTGWERNGDAAEDQRGELYAAASINGQYWGATALKVRSTPVQYSGVWSKSIAIGKPGDPNPSRTFLFSGRFYVPTGATITNDWEFSRHAFGASCGVGVSCHQYSFVGGNVSITSTDPVGQWLTRSFVIRTNPGVYTLAAGVIANIPASGFVAGQELLVDDIRIVELPASLSNDQALALANVGFANLCPSDQNTCTAFRDPALTKQTYYYLDNGKLDAAACSGRVSEKEGCLLFNKLSDTQVGWSTSATYAESRQNNNQAVGPVGSVPNDSNLILKVRRDRVCDEWLSCQSESVRFSGNQARSICYALGRCNQWGASGVGKCGNWLNPESSPQPLNVATYRARASSPKGSDVARLDWADPDYSGYSIPNYYPIDTLTQKNYSSDPQRPDIRLTYLRTGPGDLRCNGIESETVICSSYGAACTLSAQAGGGTGTCMYMDLGVAGTGPGTVGEWNATAPKLCRAYPEADAPFPDSVVKDWQPSCPPDTDCENDAAIIELAKTKETGFKDTNTCQRGEECECTYQRASYTQGENLFYGFNSTVASSFSVDDDGLADNDKDIASKLKKRDYLIGLKGYCLEKDPSRLVNGGSAQDQACLTWLPLDVVGGEISIYDYSPEAGYQATGGEAFMCNEARGNIRQGSYVLEAEHYNAYHSGEGNGCANVGEGASWTIGGCTRNPWDVNTWGSNSGAQVSFDDGNPFWPGYRAIRVTVPSNAREYGLLMSDIARVYVYPALPGWDWPAFYMYSSNYIARGTPGGRSDFDVWRYSTNTAQGYQNIPYFDVLFDPLTKRLVGYGLGTDDYTGDENEGVKYIVKFHLKEYCTEASQVAQAAENKAWTDRLMRTSGFQAVPGAEDKLGFTRARQPEPFGAFSVVPDTSQLVLSDSYRVTAPVVAISTPFSCQGNCGNTSATAQRGICISPPSRVGDLCNNSTDCRDANASEAAVCSGYLSMICVGGTNDGKFCSNPNGNECPGGGTCRVATYCSGGTTPGKICTDNNECGGGVCQATAMSSATPESGMLRVQQLFANLYDVRRYGSMRCQGGTRQGNFCSTNADCLGGGTCMGDSIRYRTVGLREGLAGPNLITNSFDISRGGTTPTVNGLRPGTPYGVPYPPQVKQVQFNAVTKAPSEGATGFTLVSVDGAVSQGDLRVLSPAPVTAIFYAYNPNGEQMPLREVLVDWDGNPTLNTNSGASGKYKNHKNICAAPKACQGGARAGSACSSDIDCGSGATCGANPAYNFGDTPQACVQDAPNTEGYFSFTKVFLCAGNEDACVGNQADGCYKADALGASQGACIFSPKVYVRDNWEWCTGNDGAGNWGQNAPTTDTNGCNISAPTSWLSSAQVSPVRIFVKPKS